MSVINKNRRKTFLRKFLFSRWVRHILYFSKHLILPGFQRVPLFDVVVFFIQGLSKGVLSQRAGAMSFQFFLSLFPLLLAGFTLLPFFNLQHYIPIIIETISQILPSSSVDFLQSTITDILSRKHKTLMSIGFLSSLYVASSGFNTLMLSFNNSVHSQKKRPWLKRRLIAILMVIGVFVAVIISLALILISRELFFYLVVNDYIDSFFELYALKAIKWTVIILLIYFAIATIYYITPIDKRGFKFFSAGATLTTIIFIVISQGFNWYIIHFSHYNALYGSIGAIIIFLLWLYLNSYVLLIGFELNASIADAYIQGKSLKENKYHLKERKIHFRQYKLRPRYFRLRKKR